MSDRITKQDLDVGDVVRTEHGRKAVVTRLEPFEDPNAPSIGPASFGYLPASRDTIRQDVVGGLAGVRIVEEIVDHREIRPLDN